MQNINEKILGAWLKLSTAICNERIVSELPYNESLVCGILHENAVERPEEKITATDLCEKTNIQKSQMNRILNTSFKQFRPFFFLKEIKLRRKIF